MECLPVDKLYLYYLEHPLVVTDSRKVTDGCLFFALKGDNFDGNRFASDALYQGAAYAVIDNPGFATRNTLLVEDVLTSLQQLARMHRASMHIPVIGITGTNGKTTTKELVHKVLSSHFRAHATSGNFNNHIGVPLTILSTPADAELAIIEMGANHPGEIGFLSSIANPTHGMITNIGKAHLEGFGGYEGVIRTKSELYQWLRSNKGLAFVNGDNPLLMNLSAEQERLLYGTGKDHYLMGRPLESGPFLKLEVELSGQLVPVTTQLVGSYNFENVLAAICAGSYFGVPDRVIIEALESYTPSNNRSQAVTTKNNQVIMDAYNANPSSMQAALENLARMAASPRMALLGDMLELGKESEEEHHRIVRLLEQLNFDRVILVGPEFTRVEGNSFPVFDDATSALQHLRQQPVSGYTILLKGSRGIRMEQLMEAL